ncbi:MAG: hypothetical protein AB8H86_20765 [Polyangiales bacterium]
MKLFLISLAIVCLSGCGDDDLPPVDGGMPDASTSNTRELAGDLREAEFELSAGQCDCRFERDGYESAEACVADLDAVTPAVRQCAVDSFAPYIEVAQASVECALEMNREYIACNDATTCADSAARTSCFEASEEARLRCLSLTPDDALDWLDDELACLSEL